MTKSSSKRITLGLFLLFSHMASAVDGVVEINHTCATQLGCFSGDTAGYPVQINGTAGNSYRLTSNLVIPNSSLGIHIITSHISIDLNGFSIIGEGCVGQQTNCTPTTGFSDGIYALSSNSIHIKNGSIIGMGGSGLVVDSGATIENINARWNKSTGIAASSNSIIKKCHTMENGRNGIHSLGSSIIKENISFNNTLVGIIGSDNSIISNNTVSGNNSHGIETNDGSIMKHNIIKGNAGFGIRSNDGANIHNNIITNNSAGGIDTHKGGRVKGNTVMNNTGIGISVNSSSLVVENSIRGNSGFGLSFFGTQSNYYGNLISVNTAGQINLEFANSSIDSGQNTCNLTSCP